MSPIRLVVAALAGIAVSAAPAGGADLPPVPQPTIPSITVPVVTPPTVSVPVPATPPTPVAPPATVATVPAPPSPNRTASTPQAEHPRSSGSAAGSTGAATRPTTRSSSTRSRTSRRPPRVAAFHLGRRALLHVSVLQEAPVCRQLGRFLFHASEGANTVRAPKRLHGHRLGAGTYLFVGTAAEKHVFDVRIRLATVDAGLVARRTHLSDTCTPRLVLASTPGRATTARASAKAASTPTPKVQPSGVKGRTKGVFRPPVLSALNPANAPTSLRPLLYALLAAAIALLAAAAGVPGRAVAWGAAGAAVVRHRTMLAIAGVWLLVAAAVITVLT